MSSLTPIQRYDLVTRVHAQLLKTGLLLVPVTSHQPWKADCEKIREAWNELADSVREMAREVDWPGARLESGLSSGA